MVETPTDSDSNHSSMDEVVDMTRAVDAVKKAAQEKIGEQGGREHK